MSEDLRSSRMPTVEGRGLAKATWEAYVKGVNKLADPIIGDRLDGPAKRIGIAVIEDLIGFWMLWNLYGGFEGLQNMGMARTTIFRKVKRFRHATGKHPDEFTLAGVSIDVAAYWSATAAAPSGTAEGASTDQPGRGD